MYIQSIGSSVKYKHYVVGALPHLIPLAADDRSREQETLFKSKSRSPSR
ncbi:hypothetical protein RSAG8_01591, partial [Rhizoctonia solani AG-8 WAC10335]